MDNNIASVSKQMEYFGPSSGDGQQTPDRDRAMSISASSTKSAIHTSQLSIWRRLALVALAIVELLWVIGEMGNNIFYLQGNNIFYQHSFIDDDKFPDAYPLYMISIVMFPLCLVMSLALIAAAIWKRSWLVLVYLAWLPVTMTARMIVNLALAAIVTNEDNIIRNTDTKAIDARMFSLLFVVFRIFFRCICWLVAANIYQKMTDYQL